MTLAFILTMPGNNSWNGRWSGDGKLFAILKTFSGTAQISKAALLIIKRNYGYNFGDGWFANVEVREVDPAEAERIRKMSQGFCGYEWMVESIMDYGKIMRDDQIRDMLAKRPAEATV
jgi:hypothetical protein